MGTKSDNKERIIYIEALRIFSAFLVIFNHTEINGYFLFSTRPVNSFLYWFELFQTVFCKCAVYVFFAISGALYLGREPDNLPKYLRRILKMAVILVLVSLIYYLALIIPAGTAFDIKAFFTMMYTANIEGALWFMYSYLAFLIVLPFLQIIASRLTDRLMAIVVITALIMSSIVPCLEFLLFKGKYTLTGWFSPFITSYIFLYPCLGHYLHNCNVEKARQRLLPLWIFNLVTIICAGLMLTYESNITGILEEANSQQFVTCFVVVNTITVYLTFKVLVEKIQNDTARKWIALFGSSTIGVYLLHPLFLERKWGGVYIRKALVASGCPKMIACYVWVIIAFLVTSVITIILKSGKSALSAGRLIRNG